LGEIYECSQVYRIFEYVEKGLGIGFTLKSVASLSSFKSNEEIICVPTENLMHSFGISYRPTHQLSEPEQKFYAFCKDWIRRF
jgi:DNA-binding transcriptional LysR family regulator